MSGQGNAPIRDGVNGDLNVKINVLPHKVLIRDGFDIRLELFVPFTSLILGDKITIPTISGDYELNIPELTQSGTTMRIRNRGVKYLNRDAKGDMIVTLKAEFPNKLDRKTKDALNTIKKINSEHNYVKFKNLKNKF